MKNGKDTQNKTNVRHSRPAYLKDGEVASTHFTDLISYGIQQKLKLSPIEIVYIGGVLTIVGALIGGLVVPLDSEIRLEPLCLES